jgi:hypothetical protein
MSQSPFLTVNAAADQLQRDRRTIARALRDVPPDDRSKGRRWKLSTIVNALNVENVPRDSAAVNAIEAASEQLSVGLKKMWHAPDVERRRAIVRDDVGALVGKLDEAMERAAADCRPHERRLLDVVRDHAIRGAIGEVLAACRWRVELGRSN